MTQRLAFDCEFGHWFNRINNVGTHLATKGFCIVKSDLEHEVRLKALAEFEVLKLVGAFTRVPKQALPALLGEKTSCWTMTLKSHQMLNERERVAAVEAEEGLRHIENKLVELGSAACLSSGNFEELFWTPWSRNPILHHSKSPKDRGAPPMTSDDLEAAWVYIDSAREKKVVALFYLGPGKATLRMVLRDDPKRVLEVAIEEECMIIYRTDAVKLNIESEDHERTFIMQMDFASLQKQNLARRSLEAYETPEELQSWYDDSLLKHLGKDSAEELPYKLVKEASVFQRRDNIPIRIVKSWHDLPRLAFLDGTTSPFEASLLGGQDCVTEIVGKPAFNRRRSATDPAVFGAKWDIEAYYDEDPANVGNMKMYTRHLAVLNRGHDAEDDFNLKKFKLSDTESFNLDPKQRMVCEATYELFRSVDIDLDEKKDESGGLSDSEIRGKEIGHFVGLSGSNDMLLNVFTRQTRINNFSWTNLGTGAMVSRLAYIFGTCGPCIAVDTEDSSGAAAVETAVTSLRSGKCLPFAVASGVSLITHPVQIIMLCAANLISRSGRSKVFDESCDGFAKGEGVVSTFLELHEEAARKPRKAPLDIQRRGSQNSNDCIDALIVGTALNSLGVSDRLNSASASAMQQLFDKISSDAKSNYFCVDAVEVHAGGQKMADQVEVGALKRHLQHRDPCAPAVLLRPHKTHYGNMGAPSGLAALCRTSVLLRKGLHGPQIHLKQLFDMSSIAEEDKEGQSRIQFITEAIPAHQPNQLVSVNSFSTTGTNVSMLVAGHVSHQGQAVAGSGVSWFPAGRTNVAQTVLRGFFIIGSWTSFHNADLMQEEGDGVYGYTLTLGENRFETFQIWMDADSDNVYHPVCHNAHKNSKVVYSSPDHTYERKGPLNEKKCWRLDGRETPIRLVNQEQFDTLDDLDLRGVVEGHCRAYPGNYIPSECQEGDGSIESMPLVETNTEDVGQPGDRYRIRFSTRGKLFNVSWTKLIEDPATDAIVSSDSIYIHKYSIIGDHSDWFFEDMEHDSQRDAYTRVIHLKKRKSKFQIYRDRDWEQCFYPSIDDGGMSSEIVGPDGYGYGTYWMIEGEVGDKFRVEFYRSNHQGKEERRITWSKDDFEKIDLVEIEKTHTWHISGSCSQFDKTVQMKRDESGNHYGDIIMSFSGQETFQLLLNGNFLCALYPRQDNGTMFGEDGTMQGPGPDGAGKFWLIGRHPEDNCRRGAFARIHLEVDSGIPKRVWWERYDTDDAHRHYLAQGAWNTFDRHCRMLGFIPYMAKTRTKAKQVGKPNFLSVRSGETKTDQKSIQGRGLQVGVDTAHPLDGNIVG